MRYVGGKGAGRSHAHQSLGSYKRIRSLSCLLKHQKENYRWLLNAGGNMKCTATWEDDKVSAGSLRPQPPWHSTPLSLRLALRPAVNASQDGNAGPRGWRSKTKNLLSLESSLIIWPTEDPCLAPWPQRRSFSISVICSHLPLRTDLGVIGKGTSHGFFLFLLFLLSLPTVYFLGCHFCVSQMF